jgi:serine/threonine protein kinase
MRLFSAFSLALLACSQAVQAIPTAVEPVALEERGFFGPTSITCGGQNIKIQEKKGEGSFGAVYKGDMGGTPVAVKWLTSKDNKWIMDAYRFAMKAARSSNLMRVHAVCSDKGKDWIISEYISGRDLFDAIPKHGLSDEKLFSWCVGLIKGTVALHDAGIAHQDIKPENSMVSAGSSLWLKLVDFDTLTNHKRSSKGCGTLKYTSVGAFSYFAKWNLPTLLTLGH